MQPFLESTRGRLKDYLLKLPQNHNFKYSDAVTQSIRSTISGLLGLTENDLKRDYHNHNHYGRACGWKLQRGETCYRCLTCGFDETCALCSFCFQPERHEGHQVHKSIITSMPSGYCDCGDPEAYKDLNCDHLHVNLGDDLSQDQLDTVYQVISIILDYVIDILSHATPILAAPRSPDAVIRFSNSATLDSSKYLSNDINSKKFALVLYNDQLHQYKDSLTRIHLATGKVIPQVEMILSTCNNYGKAIVLISEDISMLLRRQAILCSTGLSACVRSCRDVFREYMCDDLIKWLNDLIYCNYVVNNNKVMDIIPKVMLRKYKSGASIDPVPVFKDYIPLAPASLRYIPFQDKFQAEIKWSISERLKRECEYEDLTITKPDLGSYTFQASRFQLLIYNDTKFPKTIRDILQDMYFNVLISNNNYKNLVGAQFMDIYEDMYSLFLSVDREPEHSVLPFLTVQVFTCPSTCSMLMKHGDIYKILRLLFNHLKYGEVTNLKKQPRDFEDQSSILINSLKNRKWGHVFVDLNYIITRNPEKIKLFLNPGYFEMIVKILNLFEGKPTLHRESSKHVEYESTDYGLYFNAMSLISHFAENVAKSLNKVDSGELNETLTNTLYKLTIDALVFKAFVDPPFQYQRDGPQKVIDDDHESHVVFKDFSVNKVRKRLVSFDVLSDRVCFLHPLHTMLSYLIESDPTLNSPERVKQVFDMINSSAHLIDVNMKEIGPIVAGDGVKAVFDFPIRTMALLSQIKVGLWVRNGMTIRNQMNIYRYAGIREHGFMRDLFLIQLYCGFEDPDVVIPTVINRWNMIDWCNGCPYLSGLPNGHLQEMVEEFVLFLINILNEDLHLYKRPLLEIGDLRIKREIIQALCFKPLSYSKMLTMIPDTISSERRFFIVFKQVAEEVKHGGNSSSTLRELKTYKLKEEFYKEVDPYYIHYTSNKRDDCIKMLKERIHESTKLPLEDVFITPKAVSWDKSPFRSLIQITCSAGFMSVLESTLSYCIKALDKGISSIDGLVELILNLIHIAVNLPNSEKFILKFLKVSTVPRKVYDLLSREDQCIEAIPKMKDILRTIFKVLSEDVKEMKKLVPNFDSKSIILTNQNINDNTHHLLDKKKKLALKKKNKILAKFKKQQQKFAENYMIDSSDIMDIDDEEELLDDNSWQFPHEHCILCQMPARREDEPFGVISYIAESNEFRSVPIDDDYWFYKAFSGNSNLDEEEKLVRGSKVSNFLEKIENEQVIGPGFPSNSISCNDNHSVLSSCGHGMHYNCFLSLLETAKQRRLAQITRTIPEDGKRHEVLCPLCKAVNNVFIPIYYSSNSDLFKEKLEPSENFNGNQLPSFNDIVKGPVTDEHLQLIKKELVSSVKGKVKPQYWFIDEKKSTVDQQRAPFIALNHSLTIMSWLSLPFDGVSAIISKTIESVEISLRGSTYSSCSSSNPSAAGGGINKETIPLVTSLLNNQSIVSLRIWCQFRELVRCTETTTSTSTQYNKGFLTYPERLLGLLKNIFDEDDLIFDGEDYFKLLVGAEEIKSIGMTFHTLLFTCYYKHFKQSLLKVLNLIELKKDSTNEELFTELGFDESPQLNKLGDVFNSFNGCNDGAKYSKIIYSMLIRLVTPYLRQCLIYSFIRFANLYNVEYPPSFNNFNKESDKIAFMLKLPTIESMIESIKISEYSNFTSKQREQLKSSEIPYPNLIQLIRLPTKLSHFFSDFNNQLPPNTISTTSTKNMKFDDPAICLFCSHVSNIQTKNYGDRLGSCTTHSLWECINGCGFGIFLIPRSNCLLLLNRGRGSFFESPYLDDYGESDEDGKKGHDLHLSVAMYNEFMKKVWLQHNIGNQIARKLETQMDIGGWETL